MTPRQTGTRKPLTTGRTAALCCGSYSMTLPKAVSFFLHPQRPGDFCSFSAAAPGHPLRCCSKWSPGTLQLLKPTPYTTHLFSQFPILAVVTARGLAEYIPICVCVYIYVSIYVYVQRQGPAGLSQPELPAGEGTVYAMHPKKSLQ